MWVLSRLVCGRSRSGSLGRVTQTGEGRQVRGALERLVAASGGALATDGGTGSAGDRGEAGVGGEVRGGGEGRAVAAADEHGDRCPDAHAGH